MSGHTGFRISSTDSDVRTTLYSTTTLTVPLGSGTGSTSVPCPGTGTYLNNVQFSARAHGTKSERGLRMSRPPQGRSKAANRKQRKLTRQVSEEFNILYIQEILSLERRQTKAKAAVAGIHQISLEQFTR